MRRRDFNLGLLGFGGLGLSACTKTYGNSKASDEKTINFWAMGREGEVVTELMPEFIKQNPNIQVIVQQIPWSAAHEKLLTAFAGDTLPDIAQIGNSWLPEMAAIGAVAPLSSYAQVSTLLDKNDYFEGIWNTNVIDSELYGIPWYVDTKLLFYNRKILSQSGYQSVPNNWIDWQNAMRAIKKEIGDKKYSILLPVNEYEPLVTFALQVEDTILKDNASRGNMNSAGFKKALSFYDSMFKEGLAPTTAAAEISNIYDEFARGFFNFYITGPWNIGEFKRRLPEEIQDDWATSPMPGPNGFGASSAGGSSIVIMQKSKKQNQSWKLLRFLSQPDTQRKFFEITGDLPARKSAWDAGGLAKDKYASAFYEQLKLVKPAPLAPEWERIAQEMRIVAEKMVRNEFSIDAAANEMERRADRILEKRRYLLSLRGKK